MREDTVRSAAILREARLRAGFSQDELARVSGKDRTVIARYEQGIVAPSLDTLVQLLRTCGFDIPLELVPLDPGPDETMSAIQMLSPERRLERMLERRHSPQTDRVLEEQRARLRKAQQRREEIEQRRQEILRRIDERHPRLEGALDEPRQRFMEDAQRRKEGRRRRSEDAHRRWKDE